MATNEELIGVWSADAMYGPGGQSDDVLVFKPDGTGYFEFSNFAPCWAEFFIWSVESPSVLSLQGLRVMTITDDATKLVEEESDLSAAVPFSIAVEYTKSQREMPVLRFARRPWPLNSDHFGFRGKDFSKFEQPDFSWVHSAG